jgi:hypothetical protein
MNANTKRHYYRYIITLDKPMWPRTLVDELSFAGGIHPHLISVTDLQNDTHVDGRTYDTREGDYLANRRRRGLSVPAGWFLTAAPRSSHAHPPRVRNRCLGRSARRNRPGASRHTTAPGGASA